MPHFSSLISKYNNSCLSIQNHLEAKTLSYTIPNPVSGGKRVFSANTQQQNVANPMQRATEDYIFVVEMLNNYINNLLTLIKNYHYD